jgi:hypothetical protein
MTERNAAPEGAKAHQWISSYADLLDADRAAYSLHKQLGILATSQEPLLAELAQRELAVLTPLRERLARLIKIAQAQLSLEARAS